MKRSYHVLQYQHIALCFHGSPHAGWEATSPSHYCILLNVLCPVVCVFSLYLHALILFSPLLSTPTGSRIDASWPWFCWRPLPVTNMIPSGQIGNKRVCALNLFKWHDRRKVMKGVMTCLLISKPVIYFITSRVHINELWIKPGLSGFLWKVSFWCFDFICERWHSLQKSIS